MAAIVNTAEVVRCSLVVLSARDWKDDKENWVCFVWKWVVGVNVLETGLKELKEKVCCRDLW